jgi:3-dehydroquinate dehydratase
MKTEKRLKEIIVYREGGNWVANDGGYLRTLHYSIQSKQQVVDFLENDWPDRDVKVIFAK